MNSNAQLFNFALKTSNQQLIEQAINGAIVKISQSYELTDTVSGDSFGREDNEYFSKIQFLGVLTEKGLCFPAQAIVPWVVDPDFNEYKDKYRPVISKSEVALVTTISPDSIINQKLVDCRKLGAVALDTDSVYNGLQVDSVPGEKQGWLVWISEEGKTDKPSRLRYSSILKTLEVVKDNDNSSIEAPEVNGKLYGGIFIIPVQTGIGQLIFKMAGIIISDGDKWIINYPFLSEPTIQNDLTPIVAEKSGMNQLKRRPKKK